jgi:hypothetical protein
VKGGGNERGVSKQSAGSRGLDAGSGSACRRPAGLAEVAGGSASSPGVPCRRAPVFTK